MRKSTVKRSTKETEITLELTVDGTGKSDINTGIGFLDHMLTLFTFWAKMDINLHCTGDLHIDMHHTVEDIGLCLGQALQESLGDRKGIVRIADARVPMDEALAEVIVDFSGRGFLVYREDSLPEIIAGDEKDIWREFFKSFAQKAGINLHIDMRYGTNGHHLLEACFKAAGLAIKKAVFVESDMVSSTKGTLDI